MMSSVSARDARDDPTPPGPIRGEAICRWQRDADAALVRSRESTTPAGPMLSRHAVVPGETDVARRPTRSDDDRFQAALAGALQPYQAAVNAQLQVLTERLCASDARLVASEARAEALTEAVVLLRAERATDMVQIGLISSSLKDTEVSRAADASSTQQRLDGQGGQLDYIISMMQRMSPPFTTSSPPSGSSALMIESDGTDRTTMEVDPVSLKANADVAELEDQNTRAKVRKAVDTGGTFPVATQSLTASGDPSPVCRK